MIVLVRRIDSLNARDEVRKYESVNTEGYAAAAKSLRDESNLQVFLFMLALVQAMVLRMHVFTVRVAAFMIMIMVVFLLILFVVLMTMFEIQLPLLAIYEFT